MTVYNVSINNTWNDKLVTTGEPEQVYCGEGINDYHSSSAKPQTIQHTLNGCNMFDFYQMHPDKTLRHLTTSVIRTPYM